MNDLVAYNELVKVTKMLDENNIKYWLDGGTLLGVYRDKKLIGYDDDIDLGTYESTFKQSNLYRLIQLMSNLGWETATDNPSKQRFRHIKTGVSIDFFKFERSNLYYWHYCHSGYMHYSLDLFDNLILYNNNGDSFYIPNNVEKYLEEVYGESWKFPMQRFKKPRDYKNWVKYESGIIRHRYNKIIMFDVDGTLTKPRQVIDDDTKAFLVRLMQIYHVFIVGAGHCERIYHQLNKLDGLILYGNYGLSCAIGVNGELKYLYKEDVSHLIDENIEKIFNDIRNKNGYTEFKGFSYETHSTGMITFALLGTEADIKEKMTFDIDKQKRLKMLPDLTQHLPEYEVLIGGTSSFDILPKGYDKSYAVNKILEKYKKIDKKEVIFIGDDWNISGNDFGVKTTGVRCVKISNVNNVISLIRFLISEWYRIDKAGIPGEFR